MAFRIKIERVAGGTISNTGALLPGTQTQTFVRNALRRNPDHFEIIIDRPGPDGSTTLGTQLEALANYAAKIALAADTTGVETAIAAVS